MRKGKIIKALCPALFLIALPFFMTLSSYAEDMALPPVETEVTTEDLEEVIPEELLSYFQNENGVFELPNAQQILEILGKVIKNSRGGALKTLRLFLGTVLLCSIFTVFEASLKGGKTAGILKLCMLASGLSGVLLVMKDLFSRCASHLTSVNAFLTAILPLLTGAQISMGGVSSAAASSLGLQLILGFIGELILGTLLPLVWLCLAFDYASAFTSNDGVSSFAGTLRKTFVLLTGGVGTLLVTVFAFQNVIAAKTDSLSLRAFRYTAGSLVPYVGSAVSESSKTLLSGLELLRATVGGTAVTVILLWLVPFLFEILLYKTVFSFAAALSKMTSNAHLEKIYGASERCSGALAAITALCDLCVIVSFVITIGTRL